MIDSSLKAFRHKSGKYGLAATIFAAGLLVYLVTEFSVERRKDAASLQIIIGTALFVGLALGIIGLPRLESFLALFVFTLTSILFLATL